MTFLYGRECNLGSGYDKDLDSIYPHEAGISSKTIHNKVFSSFYVHRFPELHSTKHKLGSFLNQGYLNYLDFLCKYCNNDEYYCIKMELKTKTEYFDGSPRYSMNYPQYIFGINHGFYIKFVIAKYKFKSVTDIHKSLKNTYEEKDLSKLTTNQQNSNCVVLINFQRERHMKLKDIFELLWNEQDLEKYEHPYWVFYKDIPNFSSSDLKSTIENEEFFSSFLSILFYSYKKLEIKLEIDNFDYLDISELRVEVSNFDQIEIELEKIKTEFKNMDEKDFIEMYQTTKRLFKCYQNYLNYIFKNRLNVKDEDTVTYQAWIEKLKNLILLNIENPLQVNTITEIPHINTSVV